MSKRRSFIHAGRRRGLLLCVTTVIFLFVAASRAAAHDFWIEPSTFRPKANEPVQLSLRVGEHFKGDPVPRNPEKMEGFIIRGPDHYSRPVNGTDGVDPAGSLSLEADGMYVVGYRSKRSKIELEAEKFEEYLKE